MIIQINDRRKVYTIQNEFSKQFPYLKLEFYSKPKKAGAAPSRKMIKRSSKTIGECRIIHKSGQMSISDNMTISDLEQYFADIYGLGIEVLSKAGNSWKKATQKNALALAEQNKKAQINNA